MTTIDITNMSIETRKALAAPLRAELEGLAKQTRELADMIDVLDPPESSPGAPPPKKRGRNPEDTDAKPVKKLNEEELRNVQANILIVLRGLSQGSFMTSRKLAKELCVDTSWVSQALAKMKGLESEGAKSGKAYRVAQEGVEW
jgi:hypothetical protein